MPLWLAVAVVSAAYLLRSALRGFDFRPDMPSDAIAAGLFALVLSIVAYVRRQAGAQDSSDESARDSDDPEA
jgi:hypothetical protein